MLDTKNIIEKMKAYEIECVENRYENLAEERVTEIFDMAENNVFDIEKKLVKYMHSFKLKDSNNKVNFTNKSSVKYYLNYTSSINAEYCVTLGNEASCTWQKLSMTKNSAEGNINLVSGVNIAHLFIRNANRNIIATINDTINYDIEAPSCNAFIRLSYTSFDKLLLL